MAELTSWSYSKYSCYKNCPLQFKCRYIDKLPEPKAPALERGIAIHQECEDFLNDKGDITPNMEKLGKEITGLRDRGYIAEEAWGLTEDWAEIDFFSKEAWCRMKIDVHGSDKKRELTIIDFKTGKIRGGYLSQLELYSVAAFSIFNNIDVVHAELWYLDHGKIIDEKSDPKSVFHIKDYETLVKRWNRRIKPMMNDTEFRPTPNQFCNWCNFSKKKGGPCHL